MSCETKFSQLDKLCNCCLKLMGHSRVPTNEKIRDIFKRLTNISLEAGEICSDCHSNLIAFDIFRRDIILKHSAKLNDNTTSSTDSGINQEKLPPKEVKQSVKINGTAVTVVQLKALNLMPKPKAPEARKAQQNKKNELIPKASLKELRIDIENLKFPVPNLNTFEPENLQSHKENLHEEPRDEDTDDSSLTDSADECPLSEESQNLIHAHQMIRCPHCRNLFPTHEKMLKHVKLAHKIKQRTFAKRKQLQTMTIGSTKKHKNASIGEFILPD